jgi:hypothetical protein
MAKSLTVSALVVSKFGLSDSTVIFRLYIPGSKSSVSISAMNLSFFESHLSVPLVISSPSVSYSLYTTFMSSISSSTFTSCSSSHKVTNKDTRISILSSSASSKSSLGSISTSISNGTGLIVNSK